MVQGEGRGHMTQALALARFLRAAGHSVARVLVGTSPFRSLPEYFVREIDAPVETFAAPTLVPDRSAVGASVGATFVDAVARTPVFVRSIGAIRRAARDVDVVVNFLDLMGGLARMVPSDGAPSVAVAHNYWFLRDEVAGPPGGRATRALVLAYVRLTATGSVRRIALSFRPPTREDRARTDVAPPLLRPGLDDLHVRDDGYLLAYALNPGYGARLAAWQRQHPEVVVHCYLDGGAAALADPCPPGFHVHALDDTAFLDHLAACRAYVGSAGFESICEAFHLGKPVLAVPTEGHYEQTLNAWDAERAGTARSGSYDDLDDFWSAPPVPSGHAVGEFRDWVARAPDIVVDLVERAAATR